MPEVGDKLTIKKECVCSRFKHEMAKYPRDGYRKENEPAYTLHPGDVVTFVEAWLNFYGYFYRVQRDADNRLFDIEPENFG